MLTDFINLHRDPESIDEAPLSGGRQDQATVRIPLNTGSPPFGVHTNVRKAIAARAEQVPELPYPPTCGEEPLRQEIASFNQRQLGLAHSAAQITITHGAMQALFNVVRAVTSSPTDEVLLPAPFWFQFPHVVTMAGATPRIIRTPAANGFKLTPSLLVRSIGPNTRLLILTNPNNPTGLAYTADELQQLAAVIRAFPQLLVISDEVYNLLRIKAGEAGLEPCVSLGSIASIADQVITVNSFSKNQAMSGLRVGYVAATTRVSAAVCNVQRFTSLGVNVFGQAGALAATGATSEIVGDIVKKLVVRRETATTLMTELLPDMPFVPPEFAYYFWADVGAYIGRRTPDGALIKDDQDLRDYLYSAAKVEVVAGTPCGQPDYFRLTFAVKPELFEAGVTAMSWHLGKLT